MTEENLESKQPAPIEEEDSISLLDLLVVFAKHKKKILLVPILAGGIVAGYSLQLPEIFEAQTTLLPPEQQKNSSAMMMLNQLGPMAGLAGDALGVKSSGELYVSMLMSRRIGDQLIERFDLVTVFEDAKTTNDVRKALAGAMTVSLGRKDGIITISVEDRDPQRAADMANACVEELDKLTHEFALSEASQRRLFLEKQLTEAKEGLQKAEVAMKSSQEKSGLIQLDEQGRAIIEAIANLRAQISFKEVALGSLRLSATEKNPAVQRSLSELDQMRRQLAQFESSNPTNKLSGSILMNTSKVPEAGLEYLRRMRDLKYFETIHGLLKSQFEMAKVDEARDAPLIQVLDRAIPPEKRSRPKRTQMVLMAGIATGFLMCLMAFMLEAKEQAANDPEQAGKLEVFRENLWKI